MSKVYDLLIRWFHESCFFQKRPKICKKNPITSRGSKFFQCKLLSKHLEEKMKWDLFSRKSSWYFYWYNKWLHLLRPKPLATRAAEMNEGFFSTFSWIVEAAPVVSLGTVLNNKHRFVEVCGWPMVIYIFISSVARENNFFDSYLL